MSILDGAVEYFIGRSLTKIGRGVPPLPSPPLLPISGVMNLRPPVFARPSHGTRVRGQFAAEYRRFGPR